ncbi:ribonuclease III [Marasmius fiardii PR-910]|nr:ribonuclease III [Marasmius fiardii PR-910]
MTNAALRVSDDAPLPPLPKIRSRDTERKVFTHRSYYGRPNHVFEDQPDNPSPDNEKFEHLGDSVLSLVVTELLLEMFPGLRVGPSTKTRALIVSNSTLANISMRYQLPRRLHLHPAQAIALRASAHVQADVFEAFVGGLYLDQGMDGVKPWLKSLLRPYAIAAYDFIRTQHGLPPHAQSRAQPEPLSISESSSSSDSSSPSPPSSPGPELGDLDSRHSGYVHPEVQPGYLALFNQIVAKKSLPLEWIFIKQRLATQGAERNNGGPSQGFSLHETFQSTPIWIAKAMVNGKCYGEGSGRTKQAAKNEAAKKGLEELGTPI